MPRVKKTAGLALAILVGALALSACQSFEYSEIDVELGRKRVDAGTEGFLHTNAETVTEGEITFVVKNEGAFKHNLIVLETDLEPDALVVEGNRVDLGSSGAERGRIESRFLLGGASNNHTFRLDAGYYVLLSNEPGDYASGMFVGLAVLGKE